MNKTMIAKLVLPILMLLMTACTPKEKTVDFPTVGATNTTSIIIEKVEMTDSLTSLHIRGYNFPGWWIKIVKDSYLEADGLTYEMLRADGIRLGKKLKMPADGDSLFVLHFQPLPLNTKKFDFIEGHEQGAFTLLDINMTGRQPSVYSKGLPKHVKVTPENKAELPGYVYDMGLSTVNLHLLGYKPSYDIPISLYITSVLGMRNEMKMDIDKVTGRASASFYQYGSCSGKITFDYRGFDDFYIAPGETVDLYVDLVVLDNFAALERSTQKPMVDVKPIYTSGSIYDGINNCPQFSYENNEILDQNFDNEKCYLLTADEYTDRVIRQYGEAMSALEKMNLHPLTRQKRIAHLKMLSIRILAYADMYRRNAYMKDNNLDYREPCDYVPDPIEQRHFDLFTDLFDMKDPILMLCDQSPNLSVLNCNPDDSLKYGDVRYISQASLNIDMAENGQLSEEAVEQMRKWDNPFFYRICEDIQNKVLEKLDANKDKYSTASGIPLENLFETIIAPYKGKVVVVDFWNTWCSPCRSAIAHNEPLKSGELSSEDIVWIYIANNTSPVDKYLEMIPTIKGVHYRLEKEQWDQLTSKDFDLDGIPSYVLVQKDGSYALSNNFRNHDVMVKTLKSLVE